MIIPEEYYSEEKEIKLTLQDIDKIIEILETQSHSLFVFLDYQKIINKLRGNNDKNSI